MIQSQVDGGQRAGATCEELAEIMALKAENRRLRGGVEILRRATTLRRGTRPPHPLIMGFIDLIKAEDHAVESICRVLREQGCQIAARTYRSWKRTGRVVAARTVSDTHVIDVAVRPFDLTQEREELL